MLCFILRVQACSVFFCAIEKLPGLPQIGKHLLLYPAFNSSSKAFSMSLDLDGVYRRAGIGRASCNQARGKRLIPLVMTPARQAQQFSSADTDQ